MASKTAQTAAEHKEKTQLLMHTHWRVKSDSGQRMELPDDYLVACATLQDLTSDSRVIALFWPTVRVPPF
eukprot:5473874-Amphidinium_carterae.1